MKPLQNWLKPWWLSISVLTTIAILNYLPDDLAQQLKLVHEPIRQGQWWRLYSCHLLHLSFNHCLLNFAGYFFLHFSFRKEISISKELTSLVICASGVGIGLYCFNPEMYSYVGLSGVIYGLMTSYLLIGFLSSPGFSLTILGYLIYKFFFEVIQGSGSSEVEHFIGGKVATDSHLYGAISGLIPGFYFLYQERKIRNKRATQWNTEP